MNFLNVDNPFFSFITKVVNMILLSLLWLMCCIPIFTIGASTTALYYAVQKNINHDLGNATQQFFRGFKENFKQSTFVWLILFALCMLFSFDMTFFTNYGNDGHPLLYNLRYMFIVLLAIEAIYFIYLFPYLARFKNTVKNTFFNATLLIVRHPGKTLLFMLYLATVCFLVWLIPMTIVVLPAVFMWQVSHGMEKIYAKYMSPEDKEFERRRYTPGDPHED